MLYVLIAIAEADDPELGASIARYLDACAGERQNPCASFFEPLSKASSYAPRLAGAAFASELRTRLRSGVGLGRFPGDPPQHRDVVAALIEALDLDLTPEHRRQCLEMLGQTSDLAGAPPTPGSTPFESSDALRAWWARAKARPQQAELVAYAKTRRDGLLQHGVEACLAAGDEVHWLVAARALTAAGERLEAAGLAPLARRVLDGWQPQDLAEKRVREGLRELVECRSGTR